MNLASARVANEAECPLCTQPVRVVVLGGPCRAHPDCLGTCVVFGEHPNEQGVTCDGTGVCARVQEVQLL